MSDVLCRISSHIYLPQAKAERTLQLLHALLLEIQPQSTQFADNDGKFHFIRLSNSARPDTSVFGHPLSSFLARHLFYLLPIISYSLFEGALRLVNKF